MKKALAILAVAILGTTFAFAATATATNTVTLGVTCPTPAVTVAGGLTYAHTAVAGTDVGTFSMAWVITGNGALTLLTPTVAVVGTNGTAAEGFCTLNLSNAAVGSWVAPAGGSTASCNATASGSCDASITVPSYAVAGSYSWTVSYTITY